MKDKLEINPDLERQLSALNDIPARDEARASQGKAAFLRAAEELNPGVSSAAPARLNSWIATLTSPFQLYKKEHPKMFSTITSILLIVAVLFGGSSATLAAAQTSLPDQPLYAIKLWGEEMQLSLTNQEQARLELSLQYVERRMAEIQNMLNAGNPLDDAAVLRLQNQIENTLRLCLQQSSEGQQIKALQQVQTRLMTHLQTLSQLQAGAASGALTRLQNMIQQRLQWIEGGLEEPAQLRTRLQQQATGEPPANGGSNLWMNGTQTPGNGAGSGTTPCTNCTPMGTSQGSNPWTTGTPTPGSGYGPGPGSTSTCGTCTPVGTSQGSNPWTTGTPTPGSSGPGPQPTISRTPGTNPSQTVMPQSTRTPQQNGTPQGTQQGPGSQPTSPGGKP